MIWAAGWMLLSSVLVAFAAPRLAHRLPPATATMLLVSSALATVAGCAFVFGTVAFTWIAQIPEVAEEGDWSPLVLRNSDPFPAAVAVLGGIALVAGVVALVRAASRRVRAYRNLCRAVAPLPHQAGVLVIDSTQPDAYATPAAGGRIVITTAMLDALWPGEDRAVIAHERAHLRFRHSWWLIAADLAAAANPLLRPTAAAVSDAVERWADERAAVIVGDRKLVARALARAALHVHGDRARAALPMIGGQMPRRVSALLEPPPRRRIVPVLTLVALLSAVTVATANLETHTDHMFYRATTLERR